MGRFNGLGFCIVLLVFSHAILLFGEELRRQELRQCREFNRK